MKDEETTVLSPKKRKAIYYLIAKDMDVEEVADKLGKKVRTINAWLKDPVFKTALDRKMSEIEADAVNFRGRHNRLIWGAIYEEIHEKIQSGGFVDMKLTQLMEYIRGDYVGERQLKKGDNAGDEKTGEGMKELQKRFGSSNSAKVLKLVPKKSTGGTK